MMKISRKVAALLLIVFALVIDSCEKSEPELPADQRSAFIGNYASQSTGPSGNLNFTLTITASVSSADQIKIANFEGDNNATLFATVSGNSLSISSQSISGETYQGNGSVSGKNITINFSVDDGQGTPENRVLTGSRP